MRLPGRTWWQRRAEAKRARLAETRARQAAALEAVLESLRTTRTDPKPVSPQRDGETPS